MGGTGSGRGKSYMANLVDDYRSIDLAHLTRHGLVKPGYRFTLNWYCRGERTGWIEYSAQRDCLILDYKTRSYGDSEWEDVTDKIRFAWTNTNFAGRRRWFVCPSCGQRRRILYGGALFRCRKCYGLQYESQYETGWERVISRVQKTRLKLGGSASMDELFPIKPKGMHWKTYERLRQRDRAAESEWCRLMSIWMNERLYKY